ncbi:MAG: N-acetylglucosamine-6-phosphate deacetylase [Spirochaetales bacterium]|nr:N-acetylglucosamine-6-phosphate deacetylase [Spirochaetales bacterium]
MHLFINATLVLEDSLIHDGYLLEEDGVIKEFGSMPAPPFDGRTIDCNGLYLGPGFVDIHTHGAGGHDYMDGGVEAFVRAAKAHMRFGATTILPTTLSSTDEHLYRAFKDFKAAKAVSNGMPHLPGLHLEGPYFCPKEKGAMEERHLRTPDPGHYMPILEAGEGLIRRWSFAPELPGAYEMADVLKKEGIHLSAAHTCATYDQMLKAVDHGVELLTHFYSAMSTIVRIGGFRVLGVIESGYLIDDLKLEIIADGIHLPPELLRLIYKCKDADSICATTDSMRAAGLPEGPSILGPLEGGTEVIVEDGIAKMPDKTSFAGSVCTTDRMVRTLMKHVGLTLPQAVKASSLLPARFMGLDSLTGSIAVGKQADLLIFDEDIIIRSVYVSGTNTHSATAKEE